MNDDEEVCPRSDDGKHVFKPKVTLVQVIGRSDPIAITDSNSSNCMYCGHRERNIK